MAKKSFGKRLYEIRKTYKNDKGKVMSIRQFADFLGVNFGTYNKWESDSASATSSNLIDIAEKCNVSVDYLLGLSEVSARDIELKAVCDYTGLSENAVQVLHNNQNTINEIKEKTTSSLLESISYKLSGKLTEALNAKFGLDITFDIVEHFLILPQIISLIIEESATESIEAKEIEGDEWNGEEDSFYTLNPFSKDDIDFHASELINNIFGYISVNIPKGRYIKIDRNYHISEIECEFDEEGNPFVYENPFPEDESFKYKSYIHGSEYKPASEYNNQFLLDSIKEELNKLRNQYQARYIKSDKEAKAGDKE